MIRRALALILLLVMGISCVTHGVTVVQCQCSGQLFVGAGPEDCCESCADEAAAEKPQMLSGCAACAAECFVVVSRGTPPLPATLGKTEAPAPVLVTEAPRMGAIQSQPGQEGIHHRNPARREGLQAPPGASRVVLYGSLQI